MSARTLEALFLLILLFIVVSALFSRFGIGPIETFIILAPLGWVCGWQAARLDILDRKNGRL